MPGKVRVEVLKGFQGKVVLCVNDKRVTGPKCGPYDVLYAFQVEREELMKAIKETT